MANKLKVVIDTNVFIYGWFGDNEFCDKILDLIDNRKLQLLFAQDTIGELIYVTKNFVRHNLKNISDRLNALQAITVLFYYGTSVNTMKTDYQKSNDQYDDMFLKCAIQGEADYLISDDVESGMHANDIKKLGVRVVTSEEFIKIYEEYSHPKNNNFAYTPSSLLIPSIKHSFSAPPLTASSFQTFQLY